MAKHDRAAAFGGSDGQAYSVAIYVDEEPDVSMNDARIGKSCGNEMSLALPCIGGKTICKNGADVCALPNRFFIAARLAAKRMAPRPARQFPFDVWYGYHFDAVLLGQFLHRRD